ncbi:MAG TPA: hypothetical protein VHF06_28235 [Pseudonocardiaceae bacterium]|nr:hypothetical protein [Pseudonocardiaceae bacterium]
MRGRVARLAPVVSRGRTVAAAVLVLAAIQVVLGSGTADAATGDATVVVRDSMDVGLAGVVGVVAVLVGAAGMVFGLTRRHRQSLARRAAEQASGVKTP